jgi:hypothetical protein
MVRALIRRFVDSVADGQKSRLKVVFSDLRPPDNTTYDSKHLDDLDVTIIFRNRWATWRSSASKACAGWSISDSLKRRMLIRALRADADLDDRRMCIECSHLQRDGGCFAARQGWIARAATYLTPVKNMLQRCERFE